MDANALDSALAECLSHIESGQATVADCLERYPHLGDLGPLLYLALGIRQTDHPAPDPDWFAASRRRLEAAMEPKPERLMSVAGPAAIMLAWRWSWESSAASTPQLFALRVAAVVSMLLLLGGNAVTAAEASLPGSPLYTLKLAAEEARIAATFDPVSRAAVHLQIAGQRLDELAMAHHSAPLAPTADLASAAQCGMLAALGELESAAPGRRSLVRSQVAALSARTVAFSGTVRAMSSEMLRVQDVTVLLTPDTTMTGEVTAGSPVAVRAALGPDGVYRASAVSVTGGLGQNSFRSAVPHRQSSGAGLADGMDPATVPVVFGALDTADGFAAVLPDAG